ncbi:MAG TPA: hypothetical protein VD833_11620 [Vicinamibacterales bacterium]|nr:hypothetical protein [Vicinamibacterales bacterium]
MARRKILLVVDDPELRTRYELVLRFCGFEPLALSTDSALDHVPADVVAGCVLTDHRADREAVCSKLLAAAVPVVRIDPFIRHAREHLPFDVVLPACSEPRQLITALRHLMPGTAYPS